jgi:hypothetical protein
MAKAAFNRKKTLVTSKLDFSLRTVDEKYLESFEMCYWRRMDKISWTDRGRKSQGREECPTYNKKKEG